MSRLRRVLVEFHRGGFSSLLGARGRTRLRGLGSRLRTVKRRVRLLGRRTQRRGRDAGRVISSVSRRLGAPITTLSAYFDILVRGSLDTARRRRFHVHYQDTLSKLRALLRSLLRVSGVRAKLVRVGGGGLPLVSAIVSTIGHACPGTSRGRVRFIFSCTGRLRAYVIVRSGE